MNKKIFGALTFAIAFAACTNEEELVISTGSDAQLASRPQIGKVELTTESQTRAAVVDGTWGKLAYETGDIIGAALVDEPNITKSITGWHNNNGWGSANWTYAQYATDVKHEIKGQKKLFTETRTEANNSKPYNNPVSFYDLCGSGSVKNIIHTNYGYAYNGTNWTSEASLVEGNYMFYFPYNANNSTRMPVNVLVSDKQTCTEPSEAIQDLYDGTSPVAVDLAFVKKPAAGQKPVISASPKHLFAYPQFKIKNDFNGYIYNVVYGGQAKDGTAIDETAVNPYLSALATAKSASTKTMTIDKVELVYTGDGTKLWTKATINADALNTKVNANWEGNKFTTPSYTSEITDSETAPVYDERKSILPYLALANAKTYFAEYDQVLTFTVNKELAYGQEYAFNAVMPAENYGNGNLKARVYVTIDGKQYIMMVATNTENKHEGNVVNVEATAVAGMFTFEKPVELVRGERFPIIEYNTNSDGQTAVKANAGNILTINLSKLTAFEAGSYVPSATVRGFTSSTDLKNHMELATRGTALVEVTKNSGAALAEHEVAFQNNITLDASLVEAIYNNVHYGTMDAHMILNFTNLAIAKDVTVSNTYSTGTIDGRTYHIYTLTGNNKSIKVWYNTTQIAETEYKNIINTDGTKLVSGINEVSANVTLAKKNGNDGVGIVFLSAADAKIAGNANTFRIVVNSGKLTVNGNCDAQINTKNGSTLVVQKDLTNTANVFENYTTITNNDLKTIKGNIKNNTVKANVKAWPATVSTDSKVNYVVINPDNSTNITVDQANFNAFKNGGTTVELGNNVSGIRSTADVNLTAVGNLKQIKGNCTWTAASGNIIVTAYKQKDSNPDQIFGIDEDINGSVKFNWVNR